MKYLFILTLLACSSIKKEPVKIVDNPEDCMVMLIEEYGESPENAELLCNRFY